MATIRVSIPTLLMAAALLALPSTSRGQTTYSPHCSNCHLALTNGVGINGSIRAASNPTYLKYKIANGMGSPNNNVIDNTEIGQIAANISTSATVQAPSITTLAALPGGTYNVFYSTTIAATGAPTPAGHPGMGLAAQDPVLTFPATPAAFRLTGGSLPPGVTLAGSTGVISGVPSSGGTYNPQITVSNMVSPNAVRTFTIVIAKINQTVTFSSAPVVTPTFGGSNFSVSATASSGLAVTYAETGGAQPECNVTSGGVVTIVTAGSCSITATQAGNSNYNAATAVKVVTINKANKTITFGSAPTPTYSSGGSFNVSATTAGGESIIYTTTTPAVCTASGGTSTLVSIVEAGPCTIVANSALSTNYNAAPQVSQGITIAKASKTISFFPAPTPTYSVGGTFNVTATTASGESILYGTTTPSVCTASGTTSPTVSILTAGTCIVTANSAASINYNAASQATQNVTIAATLPGAPTIGTGTAGPVQATIAFTAPANTGGVTIISYTVSCTAIPTAVTATGPSSPIVVTGLSNNISTNCSVTATNSVGTGGASGSVSVTPSAAPAAPTFSSANNTTFTVGSFGTFTVTASGNPIPGIRQTGGTMPSGINMPNGPSGSATLSGTAELGTVGTHNLTFGATSSTAPAASQSFTLTIAKRNQTVTFTAPANQPYSASTITLGATSSLGLAVTYNVTTPTICSVTGNILTMLQAGICTLTANQAGDADTNAAASPSRSFTIALATQTITFNAQMGQTFVPNGSFSLAPQASTSSGMAVGYSTATPAVCSILNPFVYMHAIGTCSIVAFQPGDSRYSAATSVQQDIALTQAAQVITFPAQTTAARTFSQNGTFSIDPLATSSSGLAVTYSTPMVAVCGVSGTTVTMHSVGICNINANQPGNATYLAASTVTRQVQINVALPGAPVIDAMVPGNASASIEFTPPTSDGGSAISAYNANCNPGAIPGSNTASPITMTGLTNGVVYSCSVTATNDAGPGPASDPATVTPAVNAEAGGAIWTSLCSSCHGPVATGARYNAANPAGGSELPRSVLAYVRENQPQMASNPGVLALTPLELEDIVAYITGNLPVTQVNTGPNTPKTFDVADLTIGTVSFTGIEVVTAPTNGTLSAFTGTSVTYTPTAGFIGVDTFVYRGINPGAVGGALVGSNRTATITVSAAVPLLSVSLAGSGLGSVATSGLPAGISCGSDCSEAYAGSETVTLSATPSGTSTFAGWTGDCSGTGNCVVSMTASKSVTATFVVPSYILLVDKGASTGTGSVTSSPAGVNCGATCSAGFEEHTVVILTAAPAIGSAFSGWSGSGCSGTGTCQVSLDGMRAVTATFTVVPQSLTIAKFVGGAGAGTVTSLPAGVSCTADCTVPFDHGTTVNLTATPVAGSAFGGWTGDCSGTGSCQVTMTAARTVGYAFHPEFQTLTVQKVGSGTVTDGGMLNCGSTCVAPYLFNAAVTLTATPTNGSAFAGWSGNCAGTGVCLLTMQGARNVIATFNTGVVTASADLSVNAGATPFPASLTQDETFMFTVTNNGPSTATGVVLVASLPSGAAFVSASAGCVAGASSITCTIGAIGSGATTQVSLVVRPLVAGMVGTTASVSGVEPDPNMSNNSTTISLAVSGPPPSGTLLNISTRMQVLTGNDVMIGGFVIGGSANKTVVVRARGPSLVPFGITNALANPTLQLVRSSDQVTLAINDDWKSNTNVAAITASGFAPGNDLEAAILMSLPPGAYTAIVSGVGGGVGVGIVEVFEVDTPEAPLANISTRGRVLTGNDVMIGGFVVQGTASQTLVIRARGPSLVPFGITNAIANPTLQLVRSSDQVTLAINDDWQANGNAADIAASGFAPSNPLEAALLITLPPGAYTVIVSGVNGGTGVGIVEVFAR